MDWQQALIVTLALFIVASVVYLIIAARRRRRRTLGVYIAPMSFDWGKGRRYVRHRKNRK